MTWRSLRPTRVAWVAVCIALGVLSAAWFIVPTQGTAAQDGAPPVAAARVDPHWLALLQAERQPLEGAAELEGPAAGSITLNALIDVGDVSGFAPSGDPLTLRYVRPGSTDYTFTVYPFFTEVGWMYATRLTAYDAYTIGFQPNDQITATQGAQSVSITITPLTAYALIATDLVTGTGAANASVLAYLDTNWEAPQTITATTTTAADGVFQFDFASAVDIHGGDTGWVRQIIDSQRSVMARFVAPQIQIHVDHDQVAGLAAPNEDVLIRVLSGGSLRLPVGHTQADSAGRFGMCLNGCLTATPTSFRLVPGDQVEITSAGQVLTTTVPPLSALPDWVNGRVIGSAEPGARVSVSHWSGQPDYGWPWGAIAFNPLNAVTATASGAYTLPVTLGNRDIGLAVTRDPAGHLGYARFTLPYIKVTLGALDPYAPNFGGQSASVLTPITITVQGPSGLLKSIVRTTTSETGAFNPIYSNGSTTPPTFLFDNGDVITLSTPTGVGAVVHVPTLDVFADVGLQRISGRAPAGAHLTLHLDGIVPTAQHPYTYTTSLVAGADGRFVTDLTEVALQAPTTGWISWTNPDGNDIVRLFGTNQSCLPIARSISVGGNRVDIEPKYTTGSSCDTHTWLRLITATGVLKSETEIGNSGLAYGGLIGFVDANNGPVKILPGDHVVLVNGDQELDYLVPSLTVSVDLAPSLAVGLAPAGRVVTLTVDNQFDSFFAPLTQVATVAGPNGQYAQPLAVAPGDLVEAELAGPGWPRYLAHAVVPGASISLSSSGLLALLRPLEPYTLTLQSVRSVTPTVLTGRADDRGMPAGSFPYPVLFAPSPWAQSGDRLIFQTGNLSRVMDVPALTARFDAVLRKITGEAPPNRLLTLPGAPGVALTTTSDATGHYQFILPEGDYLGVRYTVLLTTSAGDRFAVEAGAIRWAIDLSTQCIDLSLPSPVVQARLELRTGGGVLKATSEMPTYGNPQWNWTHCYVQTQPVRVVGGDQLTLVTAEGSWTHSVPRLEASFDPKREIVTGNAPAGQWVAVNMPLDLHAWPYPIGRTVIVDAAGLFGVDVSDTTWRPGQVGTVSYVDPQGNTVLQFFTLTGIQHWLPWIGHP